MIETIVGQVVYPEVKGIRATNFITLSLSLEAEQKGGKEGEENFWTYSSNHGLNLRP